MRPPRRLDVHPLTRIERGPPVRFRHEGRDVDAYEGETVAAALYAAGRVVLARSMRYHRARGLFCGTGGCTHCFLRIDGVPNRRSCLTPCEAHTWSESQNAWPDANHDVLAAADLAYPVYLDAHTAFVRPAALRPLFLRLVRRMAGFGRVPREPLAQRYRSERLEPEVLVVGAGPAGLGAAQAAAESGARVALVEAEPKPGGRLRHLPTPFEASTQEHAPTAEGKAWADERARELRAAGVELRLGTRIYGAYDGSWAAAGPSSLVEVRPRRVVLAVGALDAYAPFPGSDRSGVLLATAALKLLNVHGIVPADPVVVYGATRDGLLLARDLVACGARVHGVYDPRPEPPAPATLVDDVRRLGVSVQVGHRAAFVAGRKRPRAVVSETGRGRVRVPCATLAMATGRWVLGELFQQAGAELGHDATRGGFLPIVGRTLETTVRGLFAAGSCAGVEDEWSSVLRGRIAGAAAALSLGPEDAERRRRLESAVDQYSPNPSGAAVILREEPASTGGAAR